MRAEFTHSAFKEESLVAKLCTRQIMALQLNIWGFSHESQLPKGRIIGPIPLRLGQYSVSICFLSPCYERCVNDNGSVF